MLEVASIIFGSDPPWINRPVCSKQIPLPALDLVRHLGNGHLAAASCLVQEAYVWHVQLLSYRGRDRAFIVKLCARCHQYFVLLSLCLATN